MDWREQLRVEAERHGDNFGDLVLVSQVPARAYYSDPDVEFVARSDRYLYFRSRDGIEVETREF